MSSTTSENQCHIDEKVESESLDVNTNISTTESRDEVKQNEANAATRSTLRNDTTKTCKIDVLQNSEQDNVNNGVHKSTDDNISVAKPYDSSFFIKSHGESKLDLHIHVEILDEDSGTELTSPKDHGELKNLTNGLREISDDNSNQNIENFDNNSNIENLKSNSDNSSSISTDSTSTWSCQQIDKECKTAAADENPIAKEDNFFDGLSMTESQFSTDLGISDQASCKIEKSEVKGYETKRRSSLNNNVSATKYFTNDVSDVLKSSKVCRDIDQNLQAPNASTAAEKILEEYSSHKSRLNIPINNLPDGQKADSKMSVLYESNNMLVETKIPRSQKEILTQDLGSMFKNVHGIFSSVSGTLKNAYIVSSSRPNMTQNVAKMLQNGSLRNASTGKIMNDIFEGGGGNEIEEGQNKEVTEERAETNTEKPVATVQPVLNPETVTRVTTYHESHSPADPRTPSPSYSEGLDLQKDTLEQLLVEQRRDITALREQYRLQATEVAEKDRLNKELEHKLELFRAHASSATRAADAAVVRYATAERGGIEARAAADRARASQRTATAELELVNGRLRSAHAEKQRICKMFDDKCHDLMQLEQQVTRLREELNAANGSLKWNQAKLRTEMDAYKESAALAEKLSQQVLALEEQCSAAQVSAADSVRARELEQQLTETQATLILERHERDKATSAARQLCADLDQVRMELATASTELYELRAKVLKLTTQKQALEEEAAELATLRARAALCDTLTAQLEIERARAMSAEDEASRQRARAESGARREAAALEHAARLTADHVAARAACEHHEAKSAALAADNTALLQRVSLWEQRYDSMQRESELYRAAAESAREECVLTAGQMETRAEELRQHLEWERGENAVLKRKHSSALKELNRELQRAIKRCEQLEARQADVTDRISNRTGSISSLNSNSEPQPEEPRVNGHAESSAALRTRENSSPEILLPERQVLIERIVELQRAGARRSERCDFLEEHGRQLTAELKKKTRLVRHLAVQLPAGALTSNERDLHKSELARLGGGSLDGMSLEMALEINRKLQSVLEDSLLKNITLKDNMDTLGAEIARLHGNPNTSKGSK